MWWESSNSQERIELYSKMHNINIIFVHKHGLPVTWIFFLSKQHTEGFKSSRLQITAKFQSDKPDGITRKCKFALQVKKCFILLPTAAFWPGRQNPQTNPRSPHINKEVKIHTIPDQISVEHRCASWSPKDALTMRSCSLGRIFVAY